MSFRMRLRKLEEQMPERNFCPECGQEARPSVGFEQHHLSGVVVRDHRTCEGCEKIAPKGDAVTTVVICPHSCWCGGDWQKAADAPRVYLDECSDEDFERYADGAAKYARKMTEMGL